MLCPFVYEALIKFLYIDSKKHAFGVRHNKYKQVIIHLNTIQNEKDFKNPFNEKFTVIY